MSARLESAIASLASTFARQVVALIGTAQVAELVAIATSGKAPSAKAALAAAAPSASRGAAPRAAAAAAKKAARPRKGGRRSSSEILAELDRIVASVAAAPGQRSEEIQKKLGIASKDIERPISIGLAKGLLRKEGEKRATRYFPGKGKAAPAKKASAKKAPAKKAAAKKAPAKKASAKKAAPARAGKKAAGKKAPAKKAAPAPAAPAAAS